MIKDYLKKRPWLFDISRRVSRILLGNKDSQYRFFDEFSKSLDRAVSFVQIGASDGLRWDPIREFVIRDHWNGIFVEPLPSAFQALKNNYSYVHRCKLEFVNAAISSASDTSLSFWTFDDDFLAGISVDNRITYSQKSSFNKEHVERWIKLNGFSYKILKEIKVPCMTVSELLENHWKGEAIDLLVIDAEGHEATIIPTIDFRIVRPKAIFFESHNLGENTKEVYEYLNNNSYLVSQIGGDSVALLTH